MNKFLAATMCMFGLLFISACADHVMKIRQIERSQIAGTSEFNPGDWKIEMSSLEPVITVINDEEHIDFFEGAKLTMIRKEK